MKTLQLYSFFLFSLVLAACNKDEAVTLTGTSAALQSGSWRVTFFSEDAEDETYHFTNYAFQFNANGTVIATKDASSVSGSWSIGNDGSTPKVILSFGPYPFSELNEDWHVLEQSNNKIRLEHISGGDGSIDLLTFEKN